jgi:hypothetical protein
MWYATEALNVSAKHVGSSSLPECALRVGGCFSQKRVEIVQFGTVFREQAPLLVYVRRAMRLPMWQA